MKLNDFKSVLESTSSNHNTSKRCFTSSTTRSAGSLVSRFAKQWREHVLTQNLARQRADLIELAKELDVAQLASAVLDASLFEFVAHKLAASLLDKKLVEIVDVFVFKLVLDQVEQLALERDALLAFAVLKPLFFREKMLR